MNTLISILLAIMSNVYTDNTTREIVRQILLSYDHFEELKAGDLAKNSFCNTSTINRFCKTIGFKSFTELKAHMVSSHEVRKAQLHHHMEITTENSVLNRIDFLTENRLDKKKFIREAENFNEIVQKSSRVVLVGAVFPEAMTFHYQEDMIEMGKCVYTTPITKELIFPVEDPDAAIILISFTGRLFSYCKNTFNEILEKYPNTIVMTGNQFNDSDVNPNNMFHLPFQGDDEGNNTVFIEIMRYLKWHYYENYVKDKETLQ